MVIGDQSFSGSSGMWLRKKPTGKARRRLKDSSNETEKAAPSLSIPDSSKPESGSEYILGWDNVRCRPIFNENETSGSSTSESSSSSDDDENEDKNEVNHCQRIGDPSPGCEEKEPSYVGCSLLSIRKDCSGAKKSRSFGSRSRKRSITAVDELDDVDMNCLAIVPISGGRCVKKTKKSKKGNANQKVTDARLVTVSGNGEAVTLMSTSPSNSSGTGAAENKAVTSRSLDLSVIDFHDGEETSTDRTPRIVSQVSCRTSLGTARYFFERLDKKEGLLKLDASSTPVVPAKIGRTQRRLSISHPSVSGKLLASDVEMYWSACGQAGVTPRPVEEFARERSNFFRPEAFYDGFLDEPS